MSLWELFSRSDLIWAWRDDVNVYAVPFKDGSPSDIAKIIENDYLYIVVSLAPHF